MDPITKYLTAVANEIANDPANLGYKGKTTQQQADLMNNSYTIMVPQIQTPRIAQIINQIPFAPNTVSSQDITNSSSPITPQVIASTVTELGQEAVPTPK